MDVHLICEGHQIVKAHKLVLAALSSFFRKIFLDFGPQNECDIFINLAEVEAADMKNILEKVYLGTFINHMDNIGRIWQVLTEFAQIYTRFWPWFFLENHHFSTEFDKLHLTEIEHCLPKMIVW